MEVSTTNGDAVRIPEPQAGVATAVRRYSKERAVILHPSDFHRLVDLERLISELAVFAPIEPTSAATDSHIDTDTPGDSITDPAVLDELFGK